MAHRCRCSCTVAPAGPAPPTGDATRPRNGAPSTTASRTAAPAHVLLCWLALLLLRIIEPRTGRTWAAVRED